ncbi:MAG: hypothetical protein PQJ48_08145 [Sphaerochaetaceae bacterium]|nr:hypothetical protein [Sphaerochaetaceae bacterium]
MHTAYSMVLSFTTVSSFSNEASFFIPQRSESSGIHGSITERVLGKRGEIPRPLGQGYWYLPFDCHWQRR